MANLTESPIYEPGIFQLEKTTPPLGGAPAFNGSNPSAGHSNVQALQLANRTAYLKMQVDAGGSATALALSLSDTADPLKGAYMVGWDGERVSDQLNMAKKLANYTALVAYTGPATRVVITQTGISGPFNKRAFVSGDTTNGGTRFVSNDGLWTWERDWNFMEAKLSWFGVKTGSFDNTVSLQLALNSGIRGFIADQGTTRWNSSISYAFAGQYIKGGGKSVTTLLAQTGASDGIIINGLSGCRLLDLKLSGSGNTGGNLLGIYNSQLFFGSGLRIENGYNGVTFTRINNCTLAFSEVVDNTGLYGIKFDGDNTFKSDVLNLNNITMSHFSNPNIDAILWESYAHSLTLNTVRIIRGGRGLYTRNSAGVQTGDARPSFLQASVVETDFSTKEGILLECMRDAWLVNIYAHGSATESNIVVGADTLTTLGSNIRSNSAFKHGIEIAGDNATLCSSSFMANSQGSSGTYDGIHVASTAAGVSVAACNSGAPTTGTPSQGYGLYIETGSSGVNYVACDFTGNVVGGVRQATDTSYSAGGTFRHLFKNDVGTHLSVGGSTANTVNNIRIAGSATGVSAKVLAEGADTNVHVEISPKGSTGTLLVTGLLAKNFASDAAAQAGGVPLNGLYHTSGTVKVRIV